MEVAISDVRNEFALDTLIELVVVQKEVFQAVQFFQWFERCWL